MMKTILPITILPIENDGYHLMVKVVINEKEASLIIDTGASKTVFDETKIIHFLEHDNFKEEERLSTGLGTTTMKSKSVVIQKIQLQEIEIIDYEATVLDLQHVNESYVKLGIDPIDGILGGDILLNCQAVIDYKNKELVLSSKMA